jgi:hypothetical protein
MLLDSSEKLVPPSPLQPMLSPDGWDAHVAAAGPGDGHGNYRWTAVRGRACVELGAVPVDVCPVDVLGGDGADKNKDLGTAVITSGSEVEIPCFGGLVFVFSVLFAQEPEGNMAHLIVAVDRGDGTVEPEWIAAIV